MLGVRVLPRSFCGVFLLVWGGVEADGDDVGSRVVGDGGGEGGGSCGGVVAAVCVCRVVGFGVV